jgi:hypothetical protein
MPTIVRLQKSRVVMCAGDHNPPHFHVLAHDGSEALVTIATLEVMRAGVSSPALREARTWAASNQALLTAKWKELNP